MDLDEGTRRVVAEVADAARVEARDRYAEMAEQIAEDAVGRYVEGDLIAAGARMVAKAIRGDGE